MCRLTWIVILALSGWAGIAHAENGIVVWKEQHFHGDESARVFVFDDMQASRDITWFSKGSQRMGFEKHQFFRYILLPPTLPAELAEAEQIATYRQQVAELDAFARSYPAAARVLNPLIEVMRGVLADCEAGQVYFSGEWMPRAEYLARVAARGELLRENSARRDAERREAERKRLEMERRDNRRYLYTYGTGLIVYLALLVTALIRGIKRLRNVLILALALTVGWKTYDHGGYGWLKAHMEKISRIWKSAGPK